MMRIAKWSIAYGTGNARTWHRRDHHLLHRRLAGIG